MNTGFARVLRTPPESIPGWVPYGVVVAAVAAITVLRLLLPVPVHDHALYMLYLLPVVFSAWYLGTVPALTATLMGGVSAAFVFAKDPGQHLLSAEHVLAVSVYATVSASVLLLSRRECQARTELETAIEAARQVAQKAKLLLDTFPSSALLLKPDGTILAINPCAALALKGRVEEMLGKNAYSFLEPEVAASRRQRVEEVLRTRAPIEFEDVRYGRKLKNYIHPFLENGDVKMLAVFGLDVTRQADAEREMNRRGEFLDLALNHAGAGVWQYDTNTGALRWSDQAYALLGLSKDSEATFGRFMELIHPDDREAMQRETQRSMEEGCSFELLFRIQRPDGSLAWIHSRGKTELDASGRACQMAGVALDVTSRMAALEALQRSEERYRHLVETANEGIWTLDRNALTTYVNAKMAELLGFTPAEMYGRHLFDFMDEDGRRIAANNLERRQAGIAETHDFCFRRKDGRSLWALVATNPIYTKGEYIGTLGMITNVTQRHLAEEALAQSEQHYRLLFETMLQGVVCQDANGKVTSMNPAAKAILGWSPEEFLNATCLNGDQFAIREDGTRLEQHEHPATLALKSGQTIRNTIVGLYNPRERNHRWLLISAVPVFRPGETSPSSVYTIFDDITERRRAEQALEQAQADLAHANAELERKVHERTEELNSFCHSVAHDLQGPIRTQAGFASLLLDRCEQFGDEEAKNYATRIAQAAERQSVIIKDLLSHMSLGQGEMELEPMTLQDISDKVIADVQAQLSETNALLEFEPGQQLQLLGQRSERLRFLAHASSLHLVLINLICNGIKFVQPGTRPHIRVSSEKRGKSVRIWVADNGIGISQADQQKLFRMFQRLNNKYPGTGMGLANVKKAVKSMSGRVGVESTPGQGSRFWFELKAAYRGKRVAREGYDVLDSGPAMLP